MVKTLKLAIIEKRFKKLHDLANFAKDNAGAIATHAQLLIHEDQTGAQTFATMNMIDDLNEWVEKFAPLDSEMQSVEERYYATSEGDTAELVETVPSTADYPTEEPYKMTEMLCKIGYIKIEGDPYQTEEKNYTDAEIVTNVLILRRSLVLCIRALANASYLGIWSKTGELITDIYQTCPYKAVAEFLKAYNVLLQED